jgi:hypothetical protein
MGLPQVGRTGDAWTPEGGMRSRSVRSVLVVWWRVVLDENSLRSPPG